MTPVYCTVFDETHYMIGCQGLSLPCWNAVADAECASGYQIVVVSGLPVATDATFEATCWSR